MADKTIWEYPTLMTAQPDDLILMASDEETYNMEVQTLKDAMGEAASKPPIVRNGNWWTWSAAAEDYVDSGTAATGPQGPQGPQGTAAGFGTVSATVDNTTGTPSVDVTTSGASTAKNFAFAFHNIKGDKGDTGNAAGFGTVSATVDNTVGTPSVEVTTSGSATAKNFAFAFHNIKGDKGDVTPAAQQAASDAQAAAQAAAGSASAAADSAQKLDSTSAYGEVGPVPIAAISDALPLNAAKLVVDIEPVQAGSGDPSPDNVRPITGWTGANVTRTGKNLFDSNSLLEASGWTVSDGIYSGLNNALHISFSGGVPNLKFKENTRYTFSTKFRCTNNKATIVGFYYKDGTKTENYLSETTETIKTFTSQANKTVSYLYFSYGGSDTIYLSECQLEEGSTASTYEPYTGTTYPISWQSVAGTVYGGTLDVVNGMLTVDRAMVDLGTLTWSGSQRFTAIVQDSLKPVGDRAIPNWVCSALKIATPNGVYGNAADYAVSYYGSLIIQARINDITDAATFKTAMSGVQLVYELATPVTYQLTPQQVALLQGVNNIWADCGDTTVGFWRNDSLSINQAITERAYDRQQGETLSDDVNALSSAMTYVISGNKSIETATIPVGSYVRLVGSTIAGRSDGIYTVAIAIPVDTVIDGTYFNESAPIPGGGLNAIRQSLEAKSKTETITFDANGYGYTSLLRSNTILFLACDTSDWNTFGVFGNNVANKWAVIGTNAALKNVSHTVALYYFDV